MRFLKKRRPLQVTKEPRSTRLSLIRWVYIAVLLAFTLWLGNFLFGDRLFLSGEGLVVGEQAVVAAEFPVTVREILVREGEAVKAGTLAAEASSQSVAETIARLSSDIAARTVRRGELQIRAQSIDAMLPLAESRQKVVRSVRRDLDTVFKRGLLPINQHTAAVDNEYRGVQDYETLKSEKMTIESELGSIGSALADAQKAISDLRNLYDNGRLVAPIDGVVTRLVASKGSVVRSGEPIMELSGIVPFVLAQIPTGALYGVERGQVVAVRTGLLISYGVIARVEPFAAALPREFQRAFTPVERQQVIRVEFLPGENPPPLFAKVRVEFDPDLAGLDCKALLAPAFIAAAAVTVR